MSTDIQPGRVRENRASSLQHPEPTGSASFDWRQWELREEDDVGESIGQQLVIYHLYSILSAWLASERPTWFVGSDTFVSWVPDKPLVRVSPDVYVLPNPRPAKLTGMLETWRPGQAPPILAVEVVSPDDWKKDYEENPLKYAQIGVQELVIFDPHVDEGGPRRVSLQQYVRVPSGELKQTHRGDGPVASPTLGLWWQVREIDGVTSLRLSRDEAGTDLLPTEAEARRAAEDEIARLRAMLAAKGGA